MLIDFLSLLNLYVFFQVSCKLWLSFEFVSYQWEGKILPGTIATFQKLCDGALKPPSTIPGNDAHFQYKIQIQNTNTNTNTKYKYKYKYRYELQYRKTLWCYIEENYIHFNIK
jgi:hypothetical protein